MAPDLTTHETELSSNELGWFLAKVVAAHGGQYEIPVAETQQEFDLSVELDRERGLWILKSVQEDAPLVTS